VLNLTDSIIRFLGEHLRYIDGAVTHKLPWSIIKPIEKLARSIIPGISFMFRPQWKYNYSVLTDDLTNKYRDILFEFEDITETSIEEIFIDLKEPFHIISFPSIERKNILLHCLIGHELGHFIVKKYLTDELTENFTKKVGPEIHNIIMDNYKSYFDPLDMFKKFYAKQEIESSIKIALQIWKRGLEEILSDIIGTLIFGPAMLFSMYELAMQKDLDHKPDYRNNFYPSWRYRLREIVRIIQRPSGKFFPLSEKYFSKKEKLNKINNGFELIKKLTEEKFDLEIIKEDELVKIAYRELEKDIVAIEHSTRYFKDELRKKILFPNKLYKDIEHLVNRIENGLPPNAVEDSIYSRRPATLIEIINAAWFYKISNNVRLLKDDGKIDNEIFDKKDTLNRLTLRAIEYSDIESEYKSEEKKFFKGQERLNECIVERNNY
jgi:hypothetical protein